LTYAGNPQDRKLRMIVIGFVVLTAAAALLCWRFAGRGTEGFRLAESSDRLDRLKAIDLLRGRTDAPAIEALFGLCSDGDERVAVAAVWALGASPTPESRERIDQLFAEKNRPARVRGQAAEMLGKFKDTAPAVLTGALLEESQPAVRAGAARGLRHLRKVKTIGFLYRALSDPDEAVRRDAYKAMSVMMVRRFAYRPELPAARQPAAMAAIKAYLLEARVKIP